MTSTNIVNGLLYESRPGKRTLYKGFGNLKIPALTASAKQKLYRENQLKKPTPGNNLSLFNNWIDVQEKTPLKNLEEELVTGSSDPESRTLRPLLEFVPKFQLYTSGGKWGGKLIEDAKQMQQNRIDSHYTSSVQSNNLIKKNAEVDQVQKEIPIIIQEIIQTSANLGVAGFGPLKKNGSGLYAGRWVSEKTGKIRVLPNASTKNLNPASYRQKLAYHEARLINLWNKLQREQEIYEDFADKDEVEFDEKFSKRLERGLTEIGAMTSLKEMTSFIVKLQKNFIKTLTNTNNDKLNDEINTLILNADTGLVKDLFLINLYSIENYIDFIPDWDQQVRAVFQGFAQEGANEKEEIKRAKAAQKLIYSSFSRVLPYVIQSLKTMVLPTNNSTNLSELKKSRQKLDSQIKTLRTNAAFNLQPISDYRVALTQLANGVSTMMTNIINQMVLENGGNSTMNLLELDQGGKKRIMEPETTALTGQNQYSQGNPYYNPGNPNNIAYQPMQQYIPPAQPNPYLPNGYFQTLNGIENQNNGVIKQEYEGQGVAIPRQYNSLNEAQKNLSRSQFGNSSSKMIEEKSKSILRRSVQGLTLLDEKARTGLGFIGWTILTEYYSLIMNAKEIAELSMNFLHRRNSAGIETLKALGSIFPINLKQLNDEERPGVLLSLFVPFMSKETKNGTPFDIKMVYEFVSAYILYQYPNAAQPLFKLTTPQLAVINENMYVSIESWGIILSVIRAANAQIQQQEGETPEDISTMIITGLLDKPIFRFEEGEEYNTAVKSIFGEFIYKAIAEETYKKVINAELLKTSSQIRNERQESSSNNISNNINSSERESSGPNTYVADSFLNKESNNGMRQEVNLANLLGARFPTDQPRAEKYYKLFKEGKRSGISQSTLKYLQENLK